MSVIIILTLAAGVIAGGISPTWFLNAIDSISSIMLYLLLFSVGIEMGLNRDVFIKIKQMGLKVLLIPIAIIIGSLAGGVAAALVFKMPINQGAAITAGLGWYSLSGILITDAGYPLIGTISFLSNIFREILAFVIIPLIAKYINFYCAIAPAGATSMDTTLAVISRNTNGKTAVIAFISGVTLTFCVPILVPIII